MRPHKLALGGYGWVAIPLLPYLYAVEDPDPAPLYVNSEMIGSLRDNYRRAHLEQIAPDTPGGARRRETGPNWWARHTTAPSIVSKSRPLKTDLSRGVLNTYDPHALIAACSPIRASPRRNRSPSLRGVSEIEKVHVAGGGSASYGGLRHGSRVCDCVMLRCAASLRQASGSRVPTRGDSGGFAVQSGGDARHGKAVRLAIAMRG